jgi:hypothetical protein
VAKKAVAPSQFEAAPEKEERLRAIFPPRVVVYEPEPNPDGSPRPTVRFNVRPFKVRDFYRVSDAVIRIAVLYSKEKMSLTGIIENALEEVIVILDTITTIEGHEDLDVSVADFEAACLPDLFARFMESISPKKWEALAAQLVRQFGLTAWVEQFKAKMRGAVQSDPSNESEISSGDGKTI